MEKFKHQLKALLVRRDIATDILQSFAKRIELVDDIEEYSYGYSESKKLSGTKFYCSKLIIKYGKTKSGEDAFIIAHDRLSQFLSDYYDYQMPEQEPWYQYYCRVSDELKEPVEEVITGTYAYNYIMKILKKHYSDEEIDECFNSHTAEYDRNNIQYHYFASAFDDTADTVITEYENCYKWDINGAHCDAICEIFPKAYNDIKKLYDQRKIHPKYKKFVNFFVGAMCIRGHRPTYNWVVQRTNGILQEAINYTYGINSQLVYANTDGFIIQNPENFINNSTELGFFKLEYAGTVQVAESNNYWIYQAGDEIKGSMPLQLRDKVDLRIGKTITYETKHIKNTDINGCEYVTYDYVNIEEKNL